MEIKIYTVIPYFSCGVEVFQMMLNLLQYMKMLKSMVMNLIV